MDREAGAGLGTARNAPESPARGISHTMLGQCGVVFSARRLGGAFGAALAQ